jgi:hypothetical protein
MTVYYISGIASSSRQEGDLRSDAWDELRYHKSKAKALRTAGEMVEADAAQCREEGMAEEFIQKNVFVKVEKLGLIPPTVANVCRMLNGIQYIRSRQEIETIWPKKAGKA